MSIVSLSFLAFFFITVFLYYALPKKTQPIILLLASIIFYIFSGLDNFIIVIFTSIIAYKFAMLMQKNADKTKELTQGLDRKQAKPIKEMMKIKSKRYLCISITIIVSILAVLKYTNFAILNLNKLLNIWHLGRIRGLELIVPLGISFYTFMMISYLTDVYRGKIVAENNFLKYATYVLYFPHITQGPIARYNETAPQLFAQHNFNYDMFIKGLWLMLWGYIKKTIIADGIAVFTDVIFDGWDKYYGIIFLIAGIIYSIQIYCDFSGCMDIVRGASECFGVKLSENFERPYFSKSLPEFWRRWHITLGTFFKDYIFYPVSTSKLFLKMNKTVRKCCGAKVGRAIASSVPILSVWLLTGLWHGPSWNFICWGLFHGILITLSTAFEKPINTLSDKLNINRECFGFSVFRMIRTFFLCVIGRIIFIAPNLNASFTMIGSIFSLSFAMPSILDFCDHNWHFLQLVTTITFFSLVLFGVSLAQEKIKKNGSNITIRDWLSNQKTWVRWTVLLIGLIAVFILGNYGAGAGKSFIYEQF